MNRIHFLILTGLSSLIAILLILQIVFVHMTKQEEARLVRVREIVTEGQAYDLHARQVATRIYQVSQQTQDQGLKDLMTRQQISIAPPADSATNAEPAAATAPH